LTNASLHQFAALTARFYDAAVDDGLWTGVAGELKSFLNLSQVGLGWIGVAGSQMLHGDCDPYFERLFVDLGPDNVFVPYMVAARPGSVFRNENIMSNASFQRTRMFNEWFVPQDDHSTLVGKLADGGVFGEGGFLSLQRGGRQASFSGRDEDMVRLLMPSLTHAIEIRRRLGLMRLQRRGAAYDAVAIGFAVTDAGGLILQHNETAGRQFAEGRGLSARRGRLATEQPSALAAAIARAVAKPEDLTPAGGDLLVTTGDDRHPAYALSIAPVADGPSFGLAVGRGAMVFIQALDRGVRGDFEARMQALFGLTPKEAALAAALASGKSLKRAAVERAITVPTARSQLAQIFRKTDTTQQSQLVSLLLGILPVDRAV
jgi:DNA-binding CsgD family transcriptional regulator